MAIASRYLQRTVFNTRRYYSSKPPLEMQRLLMPKVNLDVTNSVVALLSYFSGPDSREIPYSATRATAVFVDRTLLVTTARSVGCVSTVYDSDRSSVVHNCFISRTIAFTNAGKALRTTPLAVNFAGDVAVLKVEEAEAENLPLPPPLPVADVFAERKSPLLGISRHENTTVLIHPPSATKEAAVRAKAPWPLEEKLGWVDYGAALARIDVRCAYSGSIDRGSGSQDVGGGYSLPEIRGTPWFNIQREVVGIASWASAAAEEDDGVPKSYAVPPSRIRSMMDYAKTKGPHDPIVMDRWINARTISGHNLDICEEYIPPWTPHAIMHLLL